MSILKACIFGDVIMNILGSDPLFQIVCTDTAHCNCGAIDF